MATESFTASQQPEDPSILIPPIKAVLAEMGKSFPGQEIVALNWNKYYVAVPLDLPVELPSRGPVDGIDIRPREPVYILLHRRMYPYQAPSAYSNRSDFPASKLPHLNATRPGTAAHFCLHRGNINSWFAEHTISDFIQRIRAWLRDAARDRLIRREDGFEFTRFSDTLGIAVFDPPEIIRLVNDYWQSNDGREGHALLWYRLLKHPEKDPMIANDTFAIRFIHSIEAEEIERVLALSRRLNDLFSKETPVDRLLFGILAWPPRSRVCKKYFTEIPDTLEPFREWAEEFGIPVKEGLDLYLSKGLQLFGGVPVTLVIPRPQRVLGTRSELEPLSFAVIAGGDHWPTEGSWHSETNVYAMGHRTPMTVERAREISSHPRETSVGRILFVGCGAVGSKVVLHLARSGQADVTLVDPDNISPHNLVRHALLPDSIGRNKAEALAETIKNIFYTDGSLNINVSKVTVLDALLGDSDLALDQYKWLVDATASNMVLNVLADIQLPQELRCVRCEIADNGQLGLQMMEGLNRNPRIDDLQVRIFDLAIEHNDVSRWLVRNQEQREEQVGSPLEEINIGVSCSSDTMRLADEVVSFHAAAFSMGFRRFATMPHGQEGIVLHSHSNTTETLTANVEELRVLPVTILRARNDHQWQIRLADGVEDRMRELLRQREPNETGGILIGLVNFRRKAIYVTRMLPEPPDSQGSPFAFVRGVQDIPEEVLNVQERTGGMLGYVGEWHTHPKGGPDLSKTDRAAAGRIRRNLDTVPLPTHIMIVTKRGLYPHVFSSP